MENRIFKIKGNIVNHDEIFFGEIEYDNSMIIEVTKIDFNINENYNFILPGFIDSHTHGGYGLNFNKISSNDEIENYFNNLYSEGVTSICATTITDSIDNLIYIGEKLDSINNDSLIGWHIEGPYISKIKKGAHEESLIIEPKEEDIDKIIKSFKKIKIFTLAPEEKNIINIFKNYVSNEVVLSIGHTNASAAEAIHAIKNGFTRFTHLYNAMTNFNHRNPGVVNVALGTKSAYAELISDGIHVDKIVINNTYQILSSNKIILISDSLPVKGLEDKDYDLDNFPITKKGDVSYIQNTNTLAGSNMKYIDLVKIFHKCTNCNLNEIVKVTSFNCAKSLNLLNKYGSIKKGLCPNFVIINKNLDIISTIKSGYLVFKSK